MSFAENPVVSKNLPSSVLQVLYIQYMYVSTFVLLICRNSVSQCVTKFFGFNCVTKPWLNVFFNPCFCHENCATQNTYFSFSVFFKKTLKL